MHTKREPTIPQIFYASFVCTCAGPKSLMNYAGPFICTLWEHEWLLGCNVNIVNIFHFLVYITQIYARPKSLINYAGLLACTLWKYAGLWACNFDNIVNMLYFPGLHICRAKITDEFQNQ